MTPDRDKRIKYLYKTKLKADRIQSMLDDAKARIKMHNSLIRVHKEDQRLHRMAQHNYQQTWGEIFILNLILNYSNNIEIKVNVQTDNICGFTGNAPNGGGDHLAAPSNTSTTDQSTTLSQCERAWQSPTYEGEILEFCAKKGYGYIQPKDYPSELICAHVSGTKYGYFSPKGDIVTFKKMLIPPENEKVMAVHIELYLAEGVEHESQEEEEAIEYDMTNRRSSRSDANLFVHEPTKNGDHVISPVD